MGVKVVLPISFSSKVELSSRDNIVAVAIVHHLLLRTMKNRSELSDNSFNIKNFDLRSY